MTAREMLTKFGEIQAASDGRKTAERQDYVRQLVHDLGLSGRFDNMAKAEEGVKRELRERICREVGFAAGVSVKSLRHPDPAVQTVRLVRKDGYINLHGVKNHVNPFDYAIVTSV